MNTELPTGTYSAERDRLIRELTPDKQSEPNGCFTAQEPKDSTRHQLIRAEEKIAALEQEAHYAEIIAEERLQRITQLQIELDGLNTHYSSTLKDLGDHCATTTQGIALDNGTHNFRAVLRELADRVRTYEDILTEVLIIQERLGFNSGSRFFVGNVYVGPDVKTINQEGPAAICEKIADAILKRHLKSSVERLNDLRATLEGYSEPTPSSAVQSDGL